MKLIIENYSRFVSRFSALTFALGLAACGGGGGGGGSPAITVTQTCSNGATNYPTCTLPVDAILTVAVTPADGASGVKRDAASVTVTPNVTAGAYSSTTSSGLVCNGTTIVAADKGVQSGSVLTLNPGASLLPAYSDVCVAQGQVVASGKDGGKQATVNWKTTFTIEGAPKPTCASPQVYVAGIKACAYPMDVQVSGTSFKKLPTGCTSVTQQCWKDFVAAGSAIWLQTSQTMTGLPDARATRPIIHAGFTGSTGKQQIRQFYADTGELVNTTADIDIAWVGEGVDYVTGNSLGYYLKTLTPVQCLQWKWNGPTITNPQGGFWDYAILTCS